MRYEREFVYEILDEALVCHMGFSDAEGQPYVIPTLCARVGDELYLHGSAASRALKTVTSGVRACVTATLVDGVILARSAFFHSINYRSAMVIGTAVAITDHDDKLRALRAFTDHLVAPGRFDEVRPPSRQEFKGTMIARMPIEEASAKTRTGPPGDLEEDVDLPVWAGVIPMELKASRGVPAPGVPDGVPMPRYAAHYDRKSFRRAQ
jgi:nitroimidazol reductase NimA-like FMN-containing flavoprotein (pyridoxamine 5'-phosphate oxidase superfamily)